MKKMLVGIIVALGIMTGVNAARHISVPPGKGSVLPAQTSVAPTQIPFGKPQRLLIPKLGIDALVEEVGQDEKGNMDIPKKVMDIGWYDRGVRPGEVGNAVIAAHFDDQMGKPAVFYHLADLKQGDSINVVDEYNETLTFTVEKVTSYPTDNFPLAQVFGESHNKMLNLITCDGIFDKTKKLYSKRLVVYSQMH